MIFSWLASLGLASKLAIGASAVTVGVAGAGAVGVLPPVAQEAFEGVVTVAETGDELVETPVEETPVEETPVEETPTEEVPVDETPVEEAPVEEAPVEEAPVEEVPVEEAPAEDGEGEVYATHGAKVSAVARDKTLHGREHGKAVSAAARDKSGEQAKPEDDTAAGDSDEDEADEVEDDAAVDVKPAKKDKKAKSKGTR